VEEEGKDLTIIGKPTVQNEDAKFYKDVYVFGKLYYDFDGDDNQFGDLNVLGNAIFNGISTFKGAVNFDNELKELQVGILTVTDTFRVGGADGNPEGASLIIKESDGRLGLGTLDPTRRLDVVGDMRLSANLYDSTNNPGVLGAFLTKDSQGIKWVEFEPSFSEGIFVYNEETLVGTSSFRGINLITSGGGATLELVEGSVNPNNVNIADIAIRTFWEKRPAGLVTNSYIGIGLTLPQNHLHVKGTSRFQGDIIVLGISSFFQRSEFTQGFNATGAGSTIDAPLKVTGITSILDDFTVGGNGQGLFENSLTVERATQLDDTLFVGAASTFIGNVIVSGISTFEQNIVVGKGASITENIQVGTSATIFGTFEVGAAGTFKDKLTVEDDVKFEKLLDVTGATTLSNTLTVANNTTLQNQLNVINDVDFDSALNVDGDSTLEGTLKVGPNGTVITTTGIGSVGFGTNQPSRDIEINNKDVFFNQGAVYDSDNNVGFNSTSTSEDVRVPKSVFASVGVGTTGLIAPRFFDAAALLRQNADFIASESVGFITSTDYLNPSFSLTTSNYRNCRDDIKSILYSVANDITRGGNSQSVGAGLSYYNGNTLLHITGTDDSGYSIKDATVTAVDYASKVAKYVINNSPYPRSYQIDAIDSDYAASSRLIEVNKDFIATETVDRILATYPSHNITGGSQACVDDVKQVLDSVMYNLSFSGNDRVYDATKYYVDGRFVAGEEAEVLYGYTQMLAIVNDVIRNNTVAKVSSTLNTFTQITIGSVASRVAQVASVTSLVGIVTVGVGLTRLPDTRTDSYSLFSAQVIDQAVLPDSARNSNHDPEGCANVYSAINTLVGITSTIVGLGTTGAPTITYPDSKVVWAPRGGDSKNIIYVSKFGNDANSGRTEGDAKLTIGGAAAVAQPGDTIYIRSGVYSENNPVGLRTDVSITGQDLRLVTIYPQNDDDIFYVRRGCLVENLNFAYSQDPLDNLAPITIRGGCVAFPPPAGVGSARSGCLDIGPANEGPSGRWRSPYIRNCTNFITDSIGMKIDGNHVGSAFTGAVNPGQDLKSMVCDSFTQYNENGIGVSITNNAYAQLVSIFTINSDIAIFCNTGGSCDLTNSNSSFGNFGLVADGVGRIDFTGITTVATVGGDSDLTTLTGVADTIGNYRRPYNGQALYFKINLDDYDDTTATGIITAPLRSLRKIDILNGGSGYSQAAPPAVTISSPGGPEGISAEASVNVSTGGTITSIDVTNEGRNYLPNEELVISIGGGGGGIATAVTEPIYFTVSEATEPTPSVGITTVTLDQFIPYSIGVGVTAEMFRISRILTSSHSFEYVGTGVNINRANPFQGGVPIPENEVVATNGAQIPFTSTDQAGNFKIGEGITIDQTTSTIRGRDFSRAIQAEVTPLILALR
jgi:hypothetical protein